MHIYQTRLRPGFTSFRTTPGLSLWSSPPTTIAPLGGVSSGLEEARSPITATLVLIGEVASTLAPNPVRRRVHSAGRAPNMEDRVWPHLIVRCTQGAGCPAADSIR